MAGFVVGGIAACRRTTHCLGLLRSSCRPLCLHPSWSPLHQRRRRLSGSSRSGDFGERKTTNLVKGQTREAKSAGGLETTAAPPDPPKVPGEERPESPYEVRPEVLPIQDQPHRSQPSPAEVKPPNPHTIVCISDNKDLSGSPENVLGKNEGFEGRSVEFGSPVRNTETKDFDTKSESQIFPTSTVIDLIESPKYHSLSGTDSKDDPKFENLLAIESELKTLTASLSDFIEQPNHQPFSSIKAELNSMDSTNNQNSQGVTKYPELRSQRSSFEIKSEDSNPAELKDRTHSKEPLALTESNSRPASKSSGGSLDLKVTPTILNKPQTEKTNIQTSTPPITATNSLKQGSEPKISKTKTSRGDTSFTFNMPGENKISGIKEDLETPKDRSAEFGQLLDKVQEKRFEKVDEDKENQSNREVIQKWVEHFRLANKNTAAVTQSEASEAIPASSECNNEKKVYFIETLVKENNIWVPRSTTSSSTISRPSNKNITTKEPTSRSKLTLPLKIVPENEAPTAFKKTLKPIPSSELRSNKNTQLDVTSKATKRTEFISSQPPSTSASSSVDSKKSNAVISAKTNAVSANAKPKGQSTEEIVAMFKEENDSDQAKSEEGRVRELFDTLERFNNRPGSWWTQPELSSATKKSQSDGLPMFSSGSDEKGRTTIFEKGHLDSSDSGNKAEDTFTKLGDLDSTIREEEYDNAQKKKDKTSEDYFAKLGNLASTIREESSEKQNTSGDSENKDEKNVEHGNFDLAQKVSTFMKSAQKPPRFKRANSETKSRVETTSELTPNDLYDPIAHEISSPAPLESGKTDIEEVEEASPSLEAPEVKPKKEEAKVKAPTTADETKGKPLTAIDETKTKVDEKAPADVSQSKKERPQLDDGELALKLLDKATGEIPATTQPAPKPQAEKSLLQHLFDRILGRGRSNEGKRSMSSFSGRRHMSTSSMATPPVQTCDTKTKVIRPTSGDRAFGMWRSTSKILCEAHESKLDVQEEPPVINRLQQPELEPPAFELFAKNDDTEIKGGSPECSSPKKTPRELLREKQQTRKIKILGGSEECAKKMKRLKELTREKDDDDDCGSRHFFSTLSRFCRQLWFSIFPDAANHSNKVK
ncbi:neurofilament heavy polypeptide isoform X2 [Drosophila biarmipes]|uniref:neurofilament heavy polypeptide isoform X2 n=1 Tax=Drosophila biarmipes TaxID=125945 RepID=UPI0007E6B413|nr:neurofilament heavy polypeptide isoform X2 [Drosophila biarmipes]